MRVRFRGNGRGTQRIAKSGAVVTALVLFFQVTGLCLCSPAAKASEAGGCCPRAVSMPHHPGAPAHGFAAAARTCCPAAVTPSPAQAQLQDRTPDRQAVLALAAGQPHAQADALPPAPDRVSLLTVHSSSPPTLILRI